MRIRKPLSLLKLNEQQLDTCLQLSANLLGFVCVSNLQLLSSNFQLPTDNCLASQMRLVAEATINELKNRMKERDKALAVGRGIKTTRNRHT